MGGATRTTALACLPQFYFDALGEKISNAAKSCDDTQRCSKQQHQPDTNMSAVFKQLSTNDRDDEKPTGEKRNKQRVLILVRFAPQSTRSKLT